ncbi:MAG: truB [Gammaproteobacteria bacterium]|jgi:tRNA pseudouridine55 synthase|nr:truB [Gammaproteobacteria bacterium]
MKNPRSVNGLLLLDKPSGISSNTALQTIKTIFQAQKAGHTGSLDPLASGMLPICLGEATKFSQFLLTSDKIYRVTAKLGIQTTTGDKEGEIIQEQAVPSFGIDRINQLLTSFTGKQTQVPSMYSALKYKGQPLYKLARQGIEVERPERPIEIHYIHLLNHAADEFTFEVKSSKGTYIRTLVEDMGIALGCGAHITALRRINAAHFQEDQMQTLAFFENLRGNLTKLDSQLLPIDQVITQLPELQISEAAFYYLSQGQPIIYPYEAPTEGQVKLMRKGEQGGFLGIGKVLADGRIAPERMLHGVKN